MNCPFCQTEMAQHGYSKNWACYNASCQLHLQFLPGHIVEKINDVFLLARSIELNPYIFTPDQWQTEARQALPMSVLFPKDYHA